MEPDENASAEKKNEYKKLKAQIDEVKRRRAEEEKREAAERKKTQDKEYGKME